MMNNQHTVFLSRHSVSTTKKAEYIKNMIYTYIYIYQKSWVYATAIKYILQTHKLYSVSDTEWSRV